MAEKNKLDLKAIFKAGAIPTEAQFADLIDSQINTKETASLNATGSTQLVPASGFFNLIGTQPFIGLVAENSTTGSGISMHAGFGSDLSLGELPNNPFFKLNNGVDFLMDNGNNYTNTKFRIFKNTSLPNISPSFELLRLNDDGGLLITGSLTSSGDINITGSITCSVISASGTIIANTFQSATTTLSVNDSLDVTGNITASGNISASSAVLTGNITASGAISASGNLVVGGESTFNDEVTIAKLEKLYFDGPSGLHIYSEGTATDENQIILAKTNNLRILNQAHGKDIIFGTENASGTAKTPLTLSGSGDAVFSGNITGVTNLTVAGNINANGNIVGDDSTTITNINSIETDQIAADANNTTKIQLENTQIVSLVNDTDVFDVTETLFTHGIPVKFNSTIVGQRLPIKNLTGTSETLTAAESGKLCLFSDADGAIVTLPDSGGGSIVGVYYDFYVSVAASSNVHRINVADTTNEDIEGYLHVIDADNAASQATVANRALNSDGFDAISMNGTTTGTIGTTFRITNIAADKWYVTGNLVATGTPATPFVAS